MRRGLSLVEILAATALAALAVVGALHVQRMRGLGRRQLADVQEALRLSLGVVERAVRAAGGGLPGGRARCAEATLDGLTITDGRELRVIAAQPDTNLALAENHGTLSLRGSLAGWSAGDLFVVLGTGEPCLRTVTAVAASAVQHQAGGCNPDPAEDRCLSKAPLAPVRHFVRETRFRAAGGRLELRQAPIGNTDEKSFPWSPVADGIEALRLDPLVEDGRLAAVRVTLTAASSDGALRRSLTREIQLRN